MVPARPPPWRVFWRVKQKSAGSISPHAWKLPLLLNLWLTVLAALLVLAVDLQTKHGTSLGLFTAAVLVVLVCPLSLVWVKLAAQHHKTSNHRNKPSKSPSIVSITSDLPSSPDLSLKCAGILYDRKSRTAVVVLCPSEKRSTPRCKVAMITVVCVLVILVVLFLLLLLAGDVERNPGPTIVTMDRIDQLAALLVPVAPLWQRLLGQLGVSSFVQDQLHHNSVGKPNALVECLLNGLRHWVRSDDNPTFEKIADVLIIGFSKPLAEEVQLLAAEYKEPIAIPILQATTDRDTVAAGARLTMSDFEDVVKVLRNVVVEWYIVGLLLGIQTSSLREIRMDYIYGVHECFSQMIRLWLIGVGPKPTWANLVQALRRMRNDVLASDIEKQHMSAETPPIKRLTVDDFTDVRQVLKRSPEEWKHIGEELNIDKDTLEEIQSKHKSDDCNMNTMILEWLSGPEPTSANLAKALKSISVGKPQLAKMIEEKYPSSSPLIFSKYEKGKWLGSGAYGFVCVMKNVDTEKQYAGKCFNPDKTIEKHFGVKFRKEAAILSRLKHSNIVEYYGSLAPPDYEDYCLLMELLHCSLYSYILHSEISMRVKLAILLNVAQGLCYLHSCTPAIIHRDLTAHNVLLTANNPPIAKIADFGNSRVIEFETSSQLKEMTAEPGTKCYMAPEAFNCKERAPEASYDTQLDVFSFGHLSLFTFTRSTFKLLPKEGTEQNGEFERTEVDRRREYFQALKKAHDDSDPVVVMIKKCLSIEPNDRPIAGVLKSQLKEMKQTEEKMLSEVEGADMSGDQVLNSTPDSSDQLIENKSSTDSSGPYHNYLPKGALD